MEELDSQQMVWSHEPVVMEFTGAIMLPTIPNLVADTMLECPFEDSVNSAR